MNYCIKMLYVSKVGKVGEVKPRIQNDYCPVLELTNHLYDKNLETTDVLLKENLKTC